MARAYRWLGAWGAGWWRLWHGVARYGYHARVANAVEQNGPFWGEKPCAERKLLFVLYFYRKQDGATWVGGSTPETEVCLVGLAFSIKAGAFPWENLGQKHEIVLFVWYFTTRRGRPLGSPRPNAVLSCLSCILQQGGGVSLGSPRPKRVLVLFVLYFTTRRGRFPRKP